MSRLVFKTSGEQIILFVGGSIPSLSVLSHSPRTPLIRLLPLFMLVCSNIFMTYAWYGHLKDFRSRPLLLVIMIAWGVAFFEYCLQVPANRLGIEFYSLPQLKVIQEVITMFVFASFCFFYMKQPLSWDFLWASLCLVGAAYFMFRGLP